MASHDGEADGVPDRDDPRRQEVEFDEQARYVVVRNAVEDPIRHLNSE